MILAGLIRLGRDAEVRHLANGDAVANLAMAFNYGKKDESGQRPTQWVDGALFGKRAEALQPYLLKGTALDVVLEDVHIESYEKKDGTTGNSLRARVLALEFAGGGKNQSQDEAPQRAERQQQSKAASGPAAGGQKGSFDDMDDDLIPF